MSEDFKSMSHQYFYENFLLINGKKPPPLSEFDKQVLVAYDNLKENERLFVFKARTGGYRLMKCAEEKAKKAFQKTPQYFNNEQ